MKCAIYTVDGHRTELCDDELTFTEFCDEIVSLKGEGYIINKDEYYINTKYVVRIVKMED